VKKARLKEEENLKARARKKGILRGDITSVVLVCLSQPMTVPFEGYA